MTLTQNNKNEIQKRFCGEREEERKKKLKTQLKSLERESTRRNWEEGMMRSDRGRKNLKKRGFSLSLVKKFDK